MDIRLALHNIAYAILTKNLGRLDTYGIIEKWTMLPDLGKNSFVVSGGAGNDISWELYLVEKYGCTVVLLDPSLPGRLTFEKAQPTPSGLFFLPYGLASSTGKRFLSPPEQDPSIHSWTISREGSGEAMEFLNLTAILKQFNKSNIDLLKIDIEGFEYEVLEDMLDSDIAVRQVCVEIHQGEIFGGKTRKDRWRMIIAMLGARYKLLHHRCWDHTFYKP